jgi:hypothetical protein
VCFVLGVFWTIQTLQAWYYALKLGELRGNPEFILHEFRMPYAWMMRQMKKRLPAYRGGYPIWVWTEKPDLRYGGYLNPGTRGVRLKLELDEDLVLLSEFNAWHIVLNDGFLILNDNEEEQFATNEVPITKEESWERIFDLDLLLQSEWWGPPLKLQGVIEKVSLNQVVEVNKFMAR